MSTPPSNPSPLSSLIFAELFGTLPARADATPETRAMCDEYAMQSVTALNPMNAFEARLAVRVVAMDAHAADSIREAALAQDDPDTRRRCRAQGASMARQSDAALRALLRIQATREKQETAMHPAAMERAGYWWRAVDTSPPAAEPPMAEEPKPTEADVAAEAKLYSLMYPDRAARIRAAGGLPPDLDFGPPEPELVAALLRNARASSAPAPARVMARDAIS